MLICPQCQFENPNTNKFCQSCGTSLTSKVCPKCNANVAFSEKKCHCGTVTATVWWAIVSTVGEPTSVIELPYLDQQRRYQVLEPLPPQQKTAANEVQLRVLDYQPFQQSLLAASAQTGIATEMPAIAKTYLTLQSQYKQLPAIHDAWQQGGQQVVLIADRFDWPKLIDRWHDENTTPLQILHWLSEMVQLWAALEPWHCRQSLLELSNLRVDEDGALALQRLYADEVSKSLTVQDLGQVWQRLFQETQRTQFGSVVQLLADLKDGNLQIDDLRSRLEAIANERSANLTTQQPNVAAAQPRAAVIESNAPIVNMDEIQSSIQSDDLPTIMLPMQLISLENAGRTDSTLR